MVCSICKGSGHNRSTCPSNGGGSRAKKKAGKKKKGRGYWCPQGMVPVDDGAGGVKMMAESIFATSTKCECGGTTGVCGTAEGARKWRSHQSSQKHQDWQAANW